MSAMSNYLEGELIKHCFRTGSFTKPSALYIALCTSATADSDTGTLTGKEVSGGSYARQQLDPGDANWAAPSSGDGVTSNLAAITFPVATADWGTITHIAIVDASSGGNVLFHGALTTPKAIQTDDQLRFSIGDLTVTLA